MDSGMAPYPPPAAGPQGSTYATDYATNYGINPLAPSAPLPSPDMQPPSYNEAFGFGAASTAQNNTFSYAQLKDDEDHVETNADKPSPSQRKAK